MHYAQLNEEEIVVGISSLSGTVNNENLIKISDYDSALLGQRFVGLNEEGYGDFEEVEQEDVTTVNTIEPTAKELILMDAQADLYEQQEAIKESQLSTMSALADIYKLLQGGE